MSEDRDIDMTVDTDKCVECSGKCYEDSNGYNTCNDCGLVQSSIPQLTTVKITESLLMEMVCKESVGAHPSPI